MKNSSQLLKFTEACMRLVTQHAPPYSSKFSERTFTQPQWLVFYCPKLGVTYRELVDWLGEMPHLWESLQQLPHFTTVQQKAFQRLSTAIWCVLQRIKLEGKEIMGIVSGSQSERSNQLELFFLR